MKTKINFILIIIVLCFSCQKKPTQENNINNTASIVDNPVIINDSILNEKEIHYIQPLEEEYAPYFALLNKDGQTITTKDLLKYDKKILIFTDRTCDHCIAFYPELEKFAKKFGDEFYIVTLQYDTTVSQLQQVIKEKKYHFNMLAANDAVLMDYRISSTPTIMLLNKNNFILKNIEGMLSAEQLEAVLINNKTKK
ncbi:thioredoxin family protein [uncultured Tenacibaculum sp.]|uniref:TlpA family protein disulfide reductase n=1 Tax=uncultured Tenacibaculum sp. TaxID=174713 RepID=UPI00260C2F6E|nr:thioredoxin family protein [uncultured Tenacibaculum sp.]